PAHLLTTNCPPDRAAAGRCPRQPAARDAGCPGPNRPPGTRIFTAQSAGQRGEIGGDTAVTPPAPGLAWPLVGQPAPRLALRRAGAGHLGGLAGRVENGQCQPTPGPAAPAAPDSAGTRPPAAGTHLEERGRRQPLAA